MNSEASETCQLPGLQSGSETCVESSPFSRNTCCLENYMDERLEELLEQQSRDTQRNVNEKRGRKPLRPNDPIQKKTEERDKYWLRRFRIYVQRHFYRIEKILDKNEISFWNKYLNKKWVPAKGNEFLSYGKKYKDFLFEQITFVDLFVKWFDRHGHDELCKKCTPGSELWIVFYDYAREELINYTPSYVNSLFV